MASRPREPSTAPHPEQWYPIVLGSSLKDQPSKRYYSLRYEFKPASIDTSRPGTLHKGAENKVTVEFSNNQPGKSNVTFQGVNEDCKDSDAILFFDGKSFRLERLHRAVKTLRHMRLPGESAASASNHAETRTSPVHPNGHAAAAATAAMDDSSSHRPRVGQEQVEEIVLGSQPEPSVGGPGKKTVKPAKPSRSKPSPVPSPPRKRTSPSLLEIVDDDIDIETVAKRPKPDTNTHNNNNSVEHIDVNIDDDEGEEHESEYEVEDIDVSDDEEQPQQQQPQMLAAAEQPVQQPASSDKPQSSSSSGTSSSGSGSGSGSDSSSDSDGSDDDDDESLGDV